HNRIYSSLGHKTSELPVKSRDNVSYICLWFILRLSLVELSAHLQYGNRRPSCQQLALISKIDRRLALICAETSFHGCETLDINSLHEEWTHAANLLMRRYPGEERAVVGLSKRRNSVETRFKEQLCKGISFRGLDNITGE
ncbi:hypothetical protein ACHAXA_005462, partial [Cyclostephanos tholiformis]